MALHEIQPDGNPQKTLWKCHPVHTWRRQIDKKEAMAGTSWSEIKNLVKNKSQWRKFV